MLMLPPRVSSTLSLRNLRTKRGTRPDSDAMSPIAADPDGAPLGRPLRKNRKTSLPDLALALHDACPQPLSQRSRGFSSPDLQRKRAQRLAPSIETAPDAPAPQDWQARVGWAGRFAEAPAAAPIDPAKPHHLGSGKSGKVIRMREVATGRDVAIKKFKSNTRDCSDAARAAWREFEITRRLRCRHAIVPEEMATDDVRQKAFLVFPYVDGVTLAETPILPEARARQALIDIVTAVSDLVAQGVAHNDIHGNNIMLCKDGACLIDFGFACENDSDLLWHQDMAMLEGTLSRFWPIPKSAEARAFFLWFRARLKTGRPIRIAQDVLQHPYLAPTWRADAGQTGAPGLRSCMEGQTYII